MNQETISGIVSELKVIPTRTRRSMVTFKLSGKKCKSFGNVAEACAMLDGKETSAKDIRQVPTQKSAPPTGPAPKGMVRWHGRPGEWEQFRSQIVKCGTARMLEIFDKLPHPDCSQEQWNELIKEYRDNEKSHAEELRAHAHGLGYTDEEIADYAANTGGALDWTSGK